MDPYGPSIHLDSSYAGQDSGWDWFDAVSSELEQRLAEAAQAARMTPLGSWLIARLLRIMDDEETRQIDREQVVDGGTICQDLVIQDGGVLAYSQLNAGEDWLKVSLRSRNEDDAQRAGAALGEAFLAAPGELAVCEFRIYDPEWEHDRDGYTRRSLSRDRS